MTDMISTCRRCRTIALRDARAERDAGDEDAMMDCLREAKHYHAQVFNLLLVARAKAERSAVSFEDAE